jgi:hypothetical protein
MQRELNVVKLNLLGSALLAALFTAPLFAQSTMGNAPSWAQSMQPGTWTTISTNTISDLDPRNDPSANPNYPGNPPWLGNTGQQGVVASWNGGAFATGLGSKGSLIAWGGGHADYHGNEIYAFDMATRTWSRLSKPYPNPSYPVTNGVWPDGSPSVPHTYSTVGYHAATNSFAAMQTEKSTAGGDVVTIPMFFDLTTKQWRNGPRSPQHVQYGGWAVYDSSRDTWWMEGGDSGGTFGRYVMNGNGTSGSWTNLSAKFNALDAMAERDPINDIIVITLFRSTTSMYGLDLKNPGSSPVLLTQGNAPSRGQSHGWEWSKDRLAFTYWRGGSAVYEVKLNGSDWKTGTWMWTNLTSGSNTVTPQNSSAGIYNRFRIAAYNDMEIAVVVNSTSGPVYAFRMPAGNVVRPTAPVLNPVQ